MTSLRALKVASQALLTASTTECKNNPDDDTWEEVHELYRQFETRIALLEQPSYTIKSLSREDLLYHHPDYSEQINAMTGADIEQLADTVGEAVNEMVNDAVTDLLWSEYLA